MSGRAYADAIALAEGDDDLIDLTNEIDDQVYVSDYSEDEDGPAYITIHDDADDPAIHPAATPPQPEAPLPAEFEVPNLTLHCGLVRPGSVVELVDHSERDPAPYQSGDFLLVRAIIEDVETAEVKLRGYRLRRCTYCPGLFDNKYNELFLMVDVNVHDNRPKWVQGLEDVGIEEVLMKRDCFFTAAEYDVFGMREANPRCPKRFKDKLKIKQWIFDQGKLICRWVHIQEREGNGSSYGGEVRRMYKREVTDFTPKEFSGKSSASVPSPAPSAPTTPAKRRRSESVKAVETSPKRYQQLAIKTRSYSCGDMFSGIGGTSEGARSAGWRVSFGVENDPNAMQAYRQNFPGALHLEMNAHEFPAIVKRCIYGVDLTHFSCPCQFWSGNHTIPGMNDQKNMETIYVPDAVLDKLKSRLFSMEQTPGLIGIRKHRLHFRGLLHRLLMKRYNIRYRAQDQAWFGLPQQRRRLIFIGAKIGTPLPPFPQPMFGPSGSGLKRFKTIEDAYQVLLQQESQLRTNIYHQPHLENRMSAVPIDPHTTRANCVTTSGGDNPHYSGKRAQTAVELGRLQSLPLDFHFHGSKTEAKKQVGNCWSPVPAKHYFLTWGATLEAFDNGLIDAEDDIDDLYDFLVQRGVDLGKPPPIEIDNPSGSSAFRHIEPPRAKYRYISKLEKTVKPRSPLVLWARKAEVQPRAVRTRQAAAVPELGVDGATDSRRSRTLSIRPRARAAVQAQQDDDEDEDEVVFVCRRRKN